VKRLWWIGALAPLVVATGAYGQGRLRLSHGLKIGESRTVERVVEVTEDGYWIEKPARIGLSGALQGKLPGTHTSKRVFVPFAQLHTEVDQHPKRVLDQVTAARTALEAEVQADPKLAEQAKPTFAALDGLERRAHASLDLLRAEQLAHEIVTRGRSVPASANKGAPPRREAVQPLPGDPGQGTTSRVGAVEALLATNRELLEGSPSRRQVLEAFVRYELSLARLSGDPPADPAERRALSQALGEARDLYPEFRRVSYARWSATLENQPERAMAELADLRAQLPPRADVSAGYSWTLLQEARRVWTERLVYATPDRLPELRKVRRIWSDVIGDAAGHPLRADLEALDAVLERLD